MTTETRLLAQQIKDLALDMQLEAFLEGLDYGAEIVNSVRDTGNGPSDEIQGAHREKMAAIRAKFMGAVEELLKEEDK